VHHCLTLRYLSQTFLSLLKSKDGRPQAREGQDALSHHELLLLYGMLYLLIQDEAFTDDFCKAFCMYGYDAGVLGGVQTTQAYLDALGVCRYLSLTLTLTNGRRTEPNRRIRDPHDCKLIHPRGRSLLAGSDHRRNASRSSKMHHARRCSRDRRSKYSRVIVVGGSNHRRSSALCKLGTYHGCSED
jgi:hypothetical protein